MDSHELTKDKEAALPSSASGVTDGGSRNQRNSQEYSKLREMTASSSSSASSSVQTKSKSTHPCWISNSWPSSTVSSERKRNIAILASDEVFKDEGIIEGERRDSVESKAASFYSANHDITDGIM